MPYTTNFKNIMLNAGVRNVATATGIDVASLHTASPGETGTNEVTGGSPAYARKAITWSAASGGAVDSSNTPVFDVPAGTTVTHVGFWYDNAGTPVFAGWVDVTDEVFGSQGTYTLSDADLDLNS